MSGNEWEILAPAGQSDSLRAAVHAGADSVYLGLQRFNARQNAKNFDPEQLTKGIKYCKLNGTKIYLTLNTLVFDKEWDALQQAVQQVCALGVDAVIVQDLGVARLVREAAPDLRLHGSTQMSVHTPRGAQQLKELGFTRVILARELSLPEIQEISSVGIELEVFVHGALCMSVSGQCYLSAMLGGRSANRGSCAQPCRLPFSAGRAGACDLSLKDLSALGRLAELKQAGVCCLKIEGRMKRPEYVASAVEACKIAAEGGQPDLQSLQSVFSRSGFTNGYIDGERGPQMFGVRSKEDVTAASVKLFKSMAHRFEQPAQHLPLEMELTVRQGTPCRLTVSDGQGCQVLVEGPEPEPSVRFDLEADRAKQSLQKLGGTPYILGCFSAAIDPGLTLSAAELNQLRRAAVERMNELRSRLEPVSYRQPKPLPRAASQTLTGLRAEFARYEQIPWALTDGLEWIGLDLDEMIRHSERLAPYRDRLAILPPRGMFGTEQTVEKKLQLLARLSTFGGAKSRASAMGQTARVCGARRLFTQYCQLSG